MTDERSSPKTKKRKKINWAPYWLILPSLIYLALFFIWPMFRGLGLAVYNDEAALALQSEPSRDAATAGTLPQGTQVEILDQQGNLIPPEEAEQANLITEVWFQISAEDADGNPVEGYVSESRIRVREENEAGIPTAGSVRTRIGAGAGTLTDIYSEANENADVVGQLEARAEVAISGLEILEIWYQIRGEDNGQAVEGWAQSRYIQVFGETETGRIDRGNTGQFTTEYISRMVNDRFFWPATITTFLLMLLIIPVQFVLSIVMALVIQARLKGNSLFLYVFTIPLGISELAVGILWFSIFTQSGFINSFLQTTGLINTPITFLSADTRYWILIAIWLAEVWRATSIVMVIVVSGLQGISDEVLEAAELFGATLWQRVRHVILPMLKPSLQVALILRTILALQVFAVVIALSGGDVVTVLANETFRQYSDFRNANVAAAYAALILVISMFSAVVYLRMIRSQEEMAA
ncbi:MAG: ABC transporter permease subunit [Anaerolineae bacterium]|nr:ABC transporter permease subunit [Anaerolineae bacterium]